MFLIKVYIVINNICLYVYFKTVYNLDKIKKRLIFLIEVYIVLNNICKYTLSALIIIVIK